MTFMRNKSVKIILIKIWVFISLKDFGFDLSFFFVFFSRKSALPFVQNYFFVFF